jgi:AcrR family transcriptional regulator
MTSAESARESGRAEILAAARRLFMSRGYRAVSTRDIADAVGLTQPALYHHFGGKEALYVAVLAEELAAISAELSVAASLDAPAVDRLAAVATVLASRGEHDLAQMFHDLRQEISDHNRRRVGVAFREAMLDPILTVVDALGEDGSIDLEPSGLGRGEVAMLLLSNVRMLVEARGGPAAGPGRSPEEAGRLAARLLLRALSPGPAS